MSASEQRVKDLLEVRQRAQAVYAEQKAIEEELKLNYRGKLSDGQGHTITIVPAADEMPGGIEYKLADGKTQEAIQICGARFDELFCYRYECEEDFEKIARAKLPAEKVEQILALCRVQLPAIPKRPAIVFYQKRK
jgi:hypothetical protein